MVKITYPRTCDACKHTYNTSPNFFRHKREHCKRFQNEQVNRSIDLTGVTAGTINVTMNQATKDDSATEKRLEEVENERDLIAQELALLKLQHTSTKSANYVFLKEQWVYLCQTTHCFELHNNVYKIGRTLDMEKRKRGYPKGTIFFVILRSVEAFILEKALLAKFKLTFKPRKDYGNEYFEGSLSSMIKMMFDEYIPTVPEDQLIQEATDGATA